MINLQGSVPKHSQVLSCNLRIDVDREASLIQEISNLSDPRNRFEQINSEYVTKATTLKGRENSEIKRLNSTIDRLKREQDEMIRMKTGFFRGISRKDREQKRNGDTEELSDTQRELEVVMLDFNGPKRTPSEYDRKGNHCGAIKTFSRKEQMMWRGWFFGGAMVCL